jgi:hypothetical protein
MADELEYVVGIASFLLVKNALDRKTTATKESAAPPPPPPPPPQPITGIPSDLNEYERKTYDLRMRLVSIALEEAAKNIQEQGAFNSDSSPEIDEYNRTVYLSPGSLWCAAFVSWCVKQTLGFLPWWACGSVSGFHGKVDSAIARGGYSSYYYAKRGETNVADKIQPGWIFLNQGYSASGNRTGHTGIIVSPESNFAGRLSTVEGNSYVGVNKSGGGVFAKTQKYDNPDRSLYFDPIALTYAVPTRS